MVGLNWTCYGVAFWRQRDRCCWLRRGINPLGEAAMFSYPLRENRTMYRQGGEKVYQQRGADPWGLASRGEGSLKVLMLTEVEIDG